MLLRHDQSKKQSGFSKCYSFKILVSEQKYKNNLKNLEYEKNIFYSSHIYNVYVIFYQEIPWFYQGFQSENLCFSNLYSAHAARILDLLLEAMLSPPK